MFNFGKKYYLVADVGGTHANFAIVDSENQIVASVHFKTTEKKDFNSALQDALDDPNFKKYNITEACFSIAGPINHERTFGHFTNLPWAVDVEEIKTKFNIKNIKLINDFEAIGFAIDTMNNNQYVELTNFGRNKNYTISIIGAGTGLGISILKSLGYNRHLPIPSEGGHSDIVIMPDNPLEVKLYSYLKKNNIPVDIENLVSGPGIINIYRFLLSQKFKYNPKVLKELESKPIEEKPHVITKAAIDGTDPLSLKTLEIFIMFYARIARNLALTTLSSEIILAGGIAPNILPLMRDMFIKAFVDHERKNVKAILEGITILVIVDRSVSLYGAANAITYKTEQLQN